MIKEKKPGCTPHIYQIIFFIILIGIGIFWFSQHTNRRSEISIGILHSLSGTLAFSEKNLVDATLLAVKEINESGGILGKKITPIVADGESDPLIFADKAEQLITKDGVKVIFGCWASNTRKTVKQVVEKFNHLLFYPVQYEGFESSKNIIYTGPVPNQQIVPGVLWSLRNVAKRFFLVGSDYVFPRVANEIVKKLVIADAGEILGEEYVPLGAKDFTNIIKKIVSTKPDLIINNINGDSNIYFFQALREAGITPAKIPTMSFSIAEPELQKINVDVSGDYATWGYFQNVISAINKNFVARFKRAYGQDRVTSDPMEAAYIGVYLWKRAVERAMSFEPLKVLPFLKLESFYAPQGMVYIDSKNNHTWKFVRIGRILKDKQFLVIWESEKAVYPDPYPNYLSNLKNDFENF